MNNKIILISIISYYARQIFNGVKKFEFRKYPLKQEDLNKTIYVYSAKEDKAIIGSFTVNKIHKGNLEEILKITGYDNRNDKQEIIDYFMNTKDCYALELSQIRQFERPITLKMLRQVQPNVQLPQYYTYFTPKSPVYKLLKAIQ